MSHAQQLERLTVAERDDYEERAAILEHEAGMTRAQAERRALKLVLMTKGQR